MDGWIYLALIIGVFVFMALFAKAIVIWLFDIEKRTKLTQEQNRLLQEILHKMK